MNKLSILLVSAAILNGSVLKKFGAIVQLAKAKQPLINYGADTSCYSGHYLATLRMAQFLRGATTCSSRGPVGRYFILDEEVPFNSAYQPKTLLR